jgi:hypothetical protein
MVNLTTIELSCTVVWSRILHHDVESRAREREREVAKETPEQAAAKRVEQLWHAADSTAQRAAKLSAIAWRKSGEPRGTS